MLEIRLLGRFDVRRGGETLAIPSRPAQSLFAYLLLNPGAPHRREQLAGLLAPESTEENARSALRHALWRLRKALGADPVTGRDYFLVDELTVGLDPIAAYTLDVDLFAAPLPAAATADDLLGRISAYGGDLLPGFYEDWAQAERGRLEALFEQRMRQLLDRLVEARRWDDVLAWAEHWIALGGVPEAAYRGLMIAHAAQGDSARAAAAYRRCEEALRDELGVEPGPAAREVYERLAKGEGIPGLPATTTHLRVATSGPAPVPSDSPAPGEPPFKGLLYFDTADAGLFFGREELTAKLVRRLGESNLLVVVGASGSGKSSLVRAGLVPALMRGALAPEAVSREPALARAGSATWQYHIITPGAHPLTALALALTRTSESVTAAATLVDDLARDPRSLGLYVTRSAGHDHLLLVIDQFEELFTACRSPDERAAFVDNLLAAAPSGAPQNGVPLTVVITLRADFYAHCAEYAGLRSALAAAQEYIGAMTPAELRRAIECPAEQGGWEFEAGLVDQLLHDAGSEPGALPLLSHALLETWQRRRGRTLTLSGYAASGRVAGAIARTAQTIYTHLTPDEQAAARNIFLRLTELGQGTQDTRRRARLSELHGDESSRPLVERVLGILATARLVTLSDEAAEVAHEALIREWPLLREWLAEDREGLLVHRHLTEAAQSWEALDHDAGELYRGARLAKAAEWAEGHGSNLNSQERAFLDASRAEAEREAADREAQHQRELEAAQKLAATESARASAQRRGARFLAVGLILALVLGSVAVFLALRARQSAAEARAAAAVAQVQKNLATSRELASASQANLSADPQLSLLLAIQAAETAQSEGLPIPTDVEGALHRAVQAARLRSTVVGEAGAAISRDGALAADATSTGTIRVWPLSAWSAAGKPVGDPLSQLPGNPGGHVLALSPDHLLLADGTETGDIVLWDPATGSQTQVLKGHLTRISRLVFSLDGKTLASLSSDGIARAWDTKSGKQMFSVGTPGGPVVALDLAPNGRRLAVRTGPIEIWDTIKNKLVASIPEDTLRGVRGFAFCGLDRLVVQTFADLEVWSAEKGERLPGLDATGALPRVALACSPDGSRLATGGPSSPLRTWQITSGNGLEVVSPEGGTDRLTYSTDGALLITTGSDTGGSTIARAWEAIPGTELAAFDTAAAAGHVSLNWDGTLVAASNWDTGLLQLWTLPATAGPGAGPGASPRTTVLPAFAPNRGVTVGISFTPDGGRLATGGASGGEVRLWDTAELVASWPQLSSLDELPEGPGFTANPVWELVFSPDGSRLVARRPVAGRSAIDLWDIPPAGSDAEPAWHALPDLNFPTLTIVVAFSPNGQELAAGLQNSELQIVDVASGKLLAKLLGHRGNVTGVAYTPDGRRLATGGGDGTVKVWELEKGAAGETTSGRLLYDTKSPGGDLVALMFTAGGKRFVTAGGDGAVRLWDAATGQELLTLGQAPHSVATIALSRDGARLAAASDAVRVYALAPEDVLALARARVTRDLTPSERAGFLHEAPPAVAGNASLGGAVPPDPEDVVRAFVAAWSSGDPREVESHFADDLSFALNITGADEYPILSASDLRAFIAFHTQGNPGEFEFTGCTPGEEGVLECTLTYEDACIQVRHGQPLHLRASFRIAGGKISAVKGWAEELIALNRAKASVESWGQRNIPDDYASYARIEVTTEDHSAENGRIFLRMCEGYAETREP